MKRCPAGQHEQNGRCVPRKRFYTRDMGRGTYTVNKSDGIQKYGDGSDFFDIKIFHNRRKESAYIKELIKEGYVESNSPLYD